MTPPPAHNHGDERQAPGVACFCQWCQQPVRRLDVTECRKDAVPLYIEERIVVGIAVGDFMPRAVYPFHRPFCVAS